MKRLTIALAAAALVFPAAAQENIWEQPTRMVPPEKLEELVSFVAETSPAESGDAWLFSVVSDASQVSSIIQEDAENLSAVVVSSPAREYKRNSDAAFGAGIAAGRLFEAAASHPMLQAEMFTPPDELSAELKEELGIPNKNRTVAVVLVAERPEPSFEAGLGEDEASSFDESELAASELDERNAEYSEGETSFEARAFARGPEHHRPEHGMRPPRGFDERNAEYSEGETSFEARAFARGPEHHRPEHGMRPPRGFEERDAEYGDYAPGPDSRAFARGPESRRPEPGMRPPRGFEERDAEYGDYAPGPDSRAFARGPESRRPEHGMRSPRGFDGI